MTVHHLNCGSLCCPPGLRFFQNLNAADNMARKSNRERLRELAARQGDELP